MSEAPVDDGLPIPIVGGWSRRKYHFLGRYLDAFTTAMKDKWRELHYIDLFAGAGIARFEASQELAFSSAMLAGRVRYPFTQLHLCDADPSNTRALAVRLKDSRCPSPPRIVTGDANAHISYLLAGVPSRGALCITFADPFGLHLDFETVREIATRQSDLIVLVADNMDALRNWATYYVDNPESNLDRFMGQPGWRDVLRSAPSDRIAKSIRSMYQTQLEGLQYKYFDSISVQNRSGRDIYSLMYASRSEAGIKIWRGISMKDEGGQMSLPMS